MKNIIIQDNIIVLENDKVCDTASFNDHDNCSKEPINLPFSLIQSPSLIALESSNLLHMLKASSKVDCPSKQTIINVNKTGKYIIIR